MTSCAHFALRIGQHRAVSQLAHHCLQALPAWHEACTPEWVDFATGYCGLSPPRLIERIGILAGAGPSVKTTPTSIASGPAQRVGSRIRMRAGKRFTGRVHLAKATPTCIASTPAERLDNGMRMRVAKPSSRSIATCALRRPGMHARAGPFAWRERHRTL
jgi:hypothetical protein